MKRKNRFIKGLFFNLLHEANMCWYLKKKSRDYFEEVVKTSDRKLATNWITGDLFAVIK